jgi:PleD family two-component response regulator
MIVVSGSGRQDDIIKALRMGAKNYITKSIEDIEILNHVVQRVLENVRLQKKINYTASVWKKTNANTGR